VTSGWGPGQRGVVIEEDGKTEEEFIEEMPAVNTEMEKLNTEARELETVIGQSGGRMKFDLLTIDDLGKLDKGKIWRKENSDPRPGRFIIEKLL
jgi:hypothetical protein